MTLRYCVTGCSQSGTTYAAELLTGAGLDCGHEAVFDWTPAFELAHQPGSDRYVGESSYVAAPFAAQLAAGGMVVVHLVRPPLDVIRSVVAIGALDADDPVPYVRFLDAHCGLLDRPAGPERAAWYWLAWNRLVEGCASVTWTLPHIDVDDVTGLAARVDVDVDRDQVAHWVDTVPRDLNHTDPDGITVTVDDLGPLAGEVTATAARYGVDLTATPPKRAAKRAAKKTTRKPTTRA